MRPEVRPAVPRGLVICVIVMIPEVNQGRLACIKPIGPGLPRDRDGIDRYDGISVINGMNVIFVMSGECRMNVIFEINVMNGIFEINVMGCFVSCFALEIGSGFEFVVH